MQYGTQAIQISIPWVSNIKFPARKNEIVKVTVDMFGPHDQRSHPYFHLEPDDKIFNWQKKAQFFKAAICCLTFDAILAGGQLNRGTLLLDQRVGLFTFSTRAFMKLTWSLPTCPVFLALAFTFLSMLPLLYQRWRLFRNRRTSFFL